MSANLDFEFEFGFPEIVCEAHSERPKVECST